MTMYSAEPFSLKMISLLIRKIAAAGSLSKKTTKMVKVPKGCLPMYVGKEAKRYQVPVKYLSLPTFQELLSKSLDDHGLDTKIDGPIKLDCTTDIFDQILNLARRS